MATKDADLSSLRIDRSSLGPKSPRNARSLGKIVIWLLIVVGLAAAVVFLKNIFNPGIEVQLATA
ncbi:MAG: Efflux transporter periplasmic adaptor subunit, partial [Deltaproteobacteria bacterium]|nr:Efflux transporter periplasmic adaptor subunit [Deltaproteobacteria bacterium]